MSGIGSVSAYSSAYSAGTAKTAAARQRSQVSNRAEEMEARLDQDLAAAGVSEEVRESLEVDLQAAFEEQFASDSPPDPESMKETVNAIFEKYGLDAEQFMPQGTPPGGGPPPGGPSPATAGGEVGGSETTEDAESTESTLLETLIESLQEQVESGEIDTETAAATLSERVLDMLFGFDAEA